jgi:hypothetical protein
MCLPSAGSLDAARPLTFGQQALPEQAFRAPALRLVHRIRTGLTPARLSVVRVRMIRAAGTAEVRSG